MTAVVGVTVACLAACSTGTQEAHAPAPTSGPVLEEGGAPEGASTPTPTPLPTYAQGQAFDWQTTYSDGSTSTKWKVTLTKAECGLKSIPEGESNPEWDGSKDKPRFIDAKPEEGQEFCIVFWDWENVGDKPGGTTHAGNMWIGEQQFSGESEQMRSWTVMETMLNVDYSKDINPRGKGKSLDIYQIPAGEKATAVSFPMDTIMSGADLKVTIP